MTYRLEDGPRCDVSFPERNLEPEPMESGRAPSGSHMRAQAATAIVMSAKSFLKAYGLLTFLHEIVEPIAELADKP